MEGIIISENVERERNRKLETIVRENSPKLLSFIRRQVNDTMEAEDVLQDVFAHLTSGIPSIDDVESVSGWLYRVARNKITDLFRKKKNRSFSELDSGTDRQYIESAQSSKSSAIDDLWNESVAIAIEEALLELPAEQREVFLLYEIEGLSFREIAELTGENISTLISRKQYAVRLMRELLSDFYEELND
ncbi:MAG: sigma-70 family RNA polymerase sigma factor [Bacteroidetes bacterium]|nr:sigma-70 family RNA polymerase sigma factor [Bacteroidota bacterium]